MTILEPMRQYHIRLELLLERLEGILDFAILAREIAGPKVK